MKLLAALQVLFVVQTLGVLDCASLSSITPGACGHNFVGQTTEVPATEFLRSNFKIPTYLISTPRTHTYLCAHTRTHLAECVATPTPARGTGDRANIRIPNVVNWQMPCHVVTDATGLNWPVWAWDALEIPPVSNFQSYIDLVFTKDGTVRDSTQAFWGFGMDALYVTKVVFNDADWKDEKTMSELYGGELYFTDKARYNKDAWSEYGIPRVCDPSAVGVSVVYDFFKTCAHTWVEHPSTAMWNTQTEDSSCACSSFDSTGASLFTTNNPYYWWYGTCNKCDFGSNDIGELDNANLPSDNFDEDVDGVPNNCDLCPGFSDKLDADKDRVPDTCDRCPGFPDYVDVNSNSVPDACDNCALTGCGTSATCVDGVNSFTCMCSPGYMISGAVYNRTNAAKSFAAGVPSFRNWAAQKSAIVSSGLADPALTNTTMLASTLSSKTVSIEFVLVHDSPDFAVIAIFDEFLGAVQAQFNTCTDCGLFTVSYTWMRVRLDQNNDIVTTLWLNFVPYLTKSMYPIGKGGAGTCVLIDMCVLYGCGANSDKCVNSVVPNQRTCTCKLGFIGDAYLIGDRLHADCVKPLDLVDECATYGCSTITPGAVPGVCSAVPGDSTSRICECEVGYTGSAQLVGNAPFAGCKEIDHCRSNPCGANSICTNNPTGYGCACRAGFVDVNKATPGANCANPCFLNNGGCEGVCIPPKGNSPMSCGCSGENSMVSLLNDRACVCVEGFFGDGQTCTEKDVCLVNTVWGGDNKFFSTPQSQTRTPYSPVCLGYSESSCCSLGRPVFPIEDFKSSLRGSNKCIELMEALFCSACEPTQFQFSFKGKTFVFSICADHCQEIFQHCSTAYPSNDNADPPTYITNGYRDPIRWCEEQLGSFLPFKTSLEGIDLFVDAHGFDKSQCFSPASLLTPSFFVVTLGLIGVFSLVGVY